MGLLKIRGRPTPTRFQITIFFILYQVCDARGKQSVLQIVTEGVFQVLVAYGDVFNPLPPQIYKAVTCALLFKNTRGDIADLLSRGGGRVNNLFGTPNFLHSHLTTCRSYWLENL